MLKESTVSLLLHKKELCTYIMYAKLFEWRETTTTTPRRYTRCCCCCCCKNLLVSVVTSPSSYSNLHVSAASSSLSQSSHTNSSFKFISIQLRATEVKSMCSVERGKGTISTSPETSPNVVARSSKNTVNPLSIGCLNVSPHDTHRHRTWPVTSAFTKYECGPLVSTFALISILDSSSSFSVVVVPRRFSR